MCLVQTSYSQKFSWSLKSERFEALLKNGITYKCTGDSLFDNVMKEAIAENWQSTSFRIVEFKDLEETTFTGDEVGIMPASNSSLMLAWYKDFYNSSIEYFDAIGYIKWNGFNGKRIERGEDPLFIHLAVAALSNGVRLIKEFNISSRPPAIYSKLCDASLSNGKALKNKTLLILENNQEYINFEELKNKGIKFKVVPNNEYKEFLNGDLSEYCLFYFDRELIMIFDLSTHNTVYTQYYHNGTKRFGYPDILPIVRTWEE